MPCHHEHKIGNPRRIDRSSGCRSDNDRYLGYDPGIQGVAQKDVAVCRQTARPFLDSGAAGVVDSDHRAPGFSGQVHNFADLFAHHLGQRPPENGEVLGIDEDLPALHLAVSGHHRIAQELLITQAKLGRPVSDKGV